MARPILGHKSWWKILSTYQLLLTFFIGLGFTADLEIFGNWGHRLDAAIVPYLLYPKEAFASAFSSPLRILFTISGLSFIVSMMFWLGIQRTVFKKMEVGSRFSGLFALPILFLLIFPIRGGVQLIPMNQSSVYFSKDRQLNQSAENPIWVFFQSVLESGSSKNYDSAYIKFPTNKASELYDSLYAKSQDFEGPFVLTSQRPNIVLIVWESLSAKVVGSFGGGFPSTPNLDKISAQGLRFTNFYASGDRSDKGLASLLSAAPAIGKLSIMTQPNLVDKLPFISKTLKEAGYKTSFFYGGDLEFSNMKNFMIQAGFDPIFGKDDFPETSYNSKWGAHDEVVLGKQIEVAGKEKEPFFHVLFTLSSHEPFEVPGMKINENEPVDSLFCRAHRYTDRCIGNWLNLAKSSNWWQNTLVIIVADHGHALPKRSPDEDVLKYRIPMVWTGGALSPELNSNIQKAGSQTDLPATLLTQLQLKSDHFRFSQNLLDSSGNGFSYFSFRNGNLFQIQRDGMLFKDEKMGNLYQQSVYETYYKVKGK
jgi:phosphoglycerol transferase MdoB-like AlkP superfamily enzyme